MTVLIEKKIRNFAALMSLYCVGTVSPSQMVSAKNVSAKLFDAVLPKLRMSGVPLRLPTLFPFPPGYEETLYACGPEADKTTYFVDLGTEYPCSHATHYGTVQGSTHPFAYGHGERAAILLDNGIDGEFESFTCGGSCDDDSLTWKQGGYFYRVTMSVDYSGLIKNFANSMIDDAVQDTPPVSKR